MGRTCGRVCAETLLPNQFRTLLILCLGCLVFLLLHNAFGESRNHGTFLQTETFPKKIWQSWKVDPLRFEERDTQRARTWTVKNPGYRYEVLTDENAINYVEHHFGPHGFNRPDIVSTYTSLKARIIQADLLRYLIMYVEGGVYSDIDVEALRSVKYFIPKRFDERKIGMIIGIETDEPDLKDHPLLGSKAQSFCQWTFVCKPRLPVMMRLIDNILIWLNKLAEKQGKSISELELDFDEVLSGTGPSAFTAAILAEMSKTTGRKITWQNFHDMEESKVVGGVLVLTSEAFAAGTGHSDSGNHGGRGALVKHHFHASSWTDRHPRYKHPIYGEVERCNWDVECVKLWDANTAFFAALPKEEQMKMIAIKDLDDAAAAKHKPESEVAIGTDLSPPAGFPPSDLANDLTGAEIPLGTDLGLPAELPPNQPPALTPGLELGTVAAASSEHDIGSAKGLSQDTELDTTHDTAAGQHPAAKSGPEPLGAEKLPANHQSSTKAVSPNDDSPSKMSKDASAAFPDVLEATNDEKSS